MNTICPWLAPWDMPRLTQSELHLLRLNVEAMKEVSSG